MKLSELDDPLVFEIQNSPHTWVRHGTISLIPDDASALAVAFIFLKSDIVAGVANGITLSEVSIKIDECELWINHFYNNYHPTDTIVGRDTVSPSKDWKKKIDDHYKSIRDLIHDLLPDCRDRRVALSRLTDTWVMCRDYSKFNLQRFDK